MKNQYNMNEQGSRLSTGNSNSQESNGREGEGFRTSNDESNGTEFIQEISNDNNSLQQENTEAQTKNEKLSDKEKYEALEEYIAEALKMNVLAMNSLRIAKKFPKSHQSLIDYTIQRTGVDPDEDMIIGIFLYSTRNVMYEFFDAKNIFLNIFGSANHWRYTTEANASSDESYTNRVFCEAAGFEHAFSLLEKSLS